MALATVVMLTGGSVLVLGAPAQAAPAAQVAPAAQPSSAAKMGKCTIVGTEGDDVLIGTKGDDVICGLGGDDKIVGRGGDDVLRGGPGDDVLRGGPGDDLLAGGRGDDRLFGQRGDDVVRGDAGDDDIIGGPGDDRLGGFRGADRINALDGERFVDVVRCGPGPDEVIADARDRLRNGCEVVIQNDAPTAITLTPSSISENEPAGADIGVLAAVDPDPGDSHTFSLVPGAGSAGNALVRIDGDSLESAASYDFETESSFSVRVRATDEGGEHTEAAFTVTVTDANDAPVAVDDDVTTTEDTQLDIPVSGAGSPVVNDTDQDGDALTVSAVSGPTGGTVSISGGQIEFVPTPDLCGAGAGSFDYTVSDGAGGTDTGTVTVDITCVDDAPGAVDDSETVDEDSGATTFTVLDNDTDPEGDPIVVVGITQPANGTVTFTATDVDYTPDLNYCNAPGAAPDDTFTYTVNGGDSATVSVTVTCVNDAPVAVDDDRTAIEDTPLQDPVTGAGSPAANDDDVDGDTLTVTAVSNPTGGTVGIASGEITFSPTADLCGTGAGSYDYTVSDGNGGSDTGSVTIDITCVDDPPVANDDDRTVAEDSGPTTFATLLDNDTDVESDPITITGASDAANGATTFTATDVTYTPDADFCGTDSFTYTVNGGDTATVSVTVTCENDAPVVDLDTTSAGTGSTSVFAETDPHTGTGVFIAPDASVSDVDDANLESATITLTSRPDGNAAESLAFDSPAGSGIVGAYTEATGVLALSGTASTADYAAAIASIRYDNTTNPPDAVDRTITVVVNDGDADSTPRTATVQVVPINAAPDVDLDTLAAGNDATASFIEDGAPVAVTGTVAITDADGTTIDGATVVLTSRPDGNGIESLGFAIPGGSGISAGSGYDQATGTVTFSGASSIANYEALLESITYDNTSDTPTTTDRSVTVVVNDGLDDSTTRTSTVSVTASNDAPVNTVPGAQITDEDTTKAIAGVSVADPDDTDLTVTLSVTNGTLTLDATTGLSFTTGDGTADATMTFDGTKAAINTALGGLSYDPTPDFNGAAVLGVETSDGSLSDSDDVDITVTPVNDAPVNGVPGAQAVDEDVDLVFSSGNGNALTVSDVDGGPLTIQVTVTNGTFTLSSVAGLTGVTGNGTATVGATGSIADLNAALSTSVYRGSLNYHGPAQLTLDASDGTLSDDDTVAITVNPVNDAPVADDETFDGVNAGIGNTALVVNDPTDGAMADPAGPHKSITGDILDGDTDVDSPSLSVVPGTITSGGGTVIMEADGDFTVFPPVGCAASYSFDYTVTDGDLTDTGTVTIALTECVWYVDASVPTTGDGRSHSPLKDLSTLNGVGGSGDVDGADDYLFLYGGSTFSTGIILESGQRLFGQPQGLTVDGTPLEAAAGTRPNLHNATSGAAGITLANGSVVRGVNAGQVGTASSFGIRGIGVTTSTVGENVDIVGNSVGFGLQGVAAGDVSVAATISGNTGASVSVQQRTSGTVAVSGNVTASGANSVVEAVNNAGATINLTGKLDLSGAQLTALDLRGGGTVSVTNAASTITGVSGPSATAVNLDGVTVGAGGVILNTVSTAGGGAANGILVNNVTGTGPVTVGGGTLITSTRGLDVNGGTGDVTIGNTFEPTAGRSVEVTDHTGGTVDLNGPVNEDATGINLTGNTGATVRFDGGLVATTGVNAAFNATGGGTVVVTDPNGAGTAPDNTLTTTTGVALRVTNTTIGASGLTFRSISSNGATNGIVLNTTGGSGGLTVSGNGGSCTSAVTCTGGAIQNAAVAVSLTSTRDVAIDRMFVQNTSDSGVKGTTTTNFAFTNGIIGNSGTGLGAETSNIAFNTTAAGTENNLSGTVTITGNTLTSAYYHGVDIFNFSGTIADANISSNTITSTTSTTTSKGSGIRFVAFGSGSTIANVTKAAIANNVVSNFPSGSGIQAQGGNGNLAGPAGVFGTTGSPTNVIAITGNRVSGASAVNRIGTFAIGVVVNGNGQGNFDISGNGTLANPVGNTTGAAISVGTFGFANVTANVDNNVIAANNTLGSPGIGAGTSQTVSSAETPTLTVAIRGNSISQTDGNGILVTARDASGQVNATVRNNTVAAPLSGHRNGIRVDAGNSISLDDDICLDIANNTSAGSGLAPEAIGLRKQGTSSTENSFGVEGMAATSSPGVEAFVSGQQNAGSQSTLLISATSGFTNCSSAP